MNLQTQLEEGIPCTQNLDRIFGNIIERPLIDQVRNHRLHMGAAAFTHTSTRTERCSTFLA